MISKLLDATAAAEGDEQFVQRLIHNTGVVQVEIEDTGEVEIQGRCDESAPWHTLETYTQSGANLIALFPRMRAVANSVSGGAVRVWLSF